MSQPRRPQTDEPALTIGALDLWVLGREFPEATDDFDSNWLRVVARYTGNGSRVEVTGPLLDAASFCRFLASVSEMERSLAGSAELFSYEPNIKVSLHFVDNLGHIGGSVELTADHLTESHKFALSLDQTTLPQVRRQLQEIMNAFPVRGTRSSGV